MSDWAVVSKVGSVTVTKYRWNNAGVMTDVTLSAQDGYLLESMELSVRGEVAQFHPAGQRTATRKATGRQYGVSASRGLEDDSLIGVGEKVLSLLAVIAPKAEQVYVIYLDANGTKRFEGWMVPQSATSTLRAADFERQSVELLSTGAWVYPA